MPDSGSTPNKSFTRSVAGFTGTDAFQQLDASGRFILAEDQDEADNDSAAALNNRLMKDGGNWNVDVDIQTHKFTNVGNASARTHFAAAGQVADSTLVFAGTSSGTDTITATLAPAITAYVAGQRYHFKAGGTNTGAATINFNSVGAKDIKKGPDGATALAAGDITEDGMYVVIYDGTNFQLLNPGLGLTAGAGLTINDNIIAVGAGTGITVNADDVAVDKATAAEVRSAASNQVLTADLIESASALVTLTETAGAVAVNWDAFIAATVTVDQATVISNPTNGQPGTWRTIYVIGNDATDRTITFGNQFLGEVPVITDVDSTRAYLLMIYCHTTSHFVVSSKKALGT